MPGNDFIDGQKAGKIPFSQTFGGNLLVGAADSAIGGIIDAATMGLRYKYAERAAENQYKRELEFWDKQNEYNSPVEMRKRLEAAGLNASALLGSGSTDAGGSAGGLSNVPGNDYAKQGMPGSLQFRDPVQNAMALAQIRNIDADTQDKLSHSDLNKNTVSLQESIINLNNTTSNLYEKKIITEGTYNGLLEVQKDISDLELRFQNETFDVRKGIIENTEEKIYQEWNLLAEEVAGKKYFNDEIQPLQKQELQETINQLKVYAVYINSLKKLTDKQVEVNQQALYNMVAENQFLYGTETDIGYTQLLRDLAANDLSYGGFRHLTKGIGDVLTGVGSALGGIASFKRSVSAAGTTITTKYEEEYGPHGELRGVTTGKTTVANVK